MSKEITLPVEDPDFMLCLFQGTTNRVHVAASIHVPLHIIALPLRSERLESVKMVAYHLSSVR